MGILKLVRAEQSCYCFWQTNLAHELGKQAADKVSLAPDY